MTSGLVVAVSPKLLGDTLTANVAAGATVLPVRNAGEFDEEFDEPRYVVIGETLTPLLYVAVENDDDAAQQSVTLAAGLPFAADAGLPITIWDPTVESDDKRAVEFVAQVRLDDQDDAVIPATIDHALVPLAGIYTLEGARVSLDDDDGEWFIARVLGRAAVVTSDVISTPRTKGRLTVDQPIATGGANWQTLMGFEVLTPSPDVTLDPLTGAWVFHKAGEYLCLLAASYALNPTGNRGLRATIVRFDTGITEGTSTTRIPTSVDQVVGLQHFTADRFSPGDSIRFEASQNSGDDVSIISGFTKVTITRTSA